MREFKDGDVMVVEPFRSRAFPVIKDLVIDRSAFDRIIQSGGYVSVRHRQRAGRERDCRYRRTMPDKSMDAAACIGCGACVAACKNASAMLFVSAKLAHLSLLPQGRAEWRKRALSMVRAMDKAGFGCCTNEGECELECPKEIKMVNIARMNRQFLAALLLEE